MPVANVDMAPNFVVEVGHGVRDRLPEDRREREAAPASLNFFPQVPEHCRHGLLVCYPDIHPVDYAYVSLPYQRHHFLVKAVVCLGVENHKVVRVLFKKRFGVGRKLADENIKLKLFVLHRVADLVDAPSDLLFFWIRERAKSTYIYIYMYRNLYYY